MDLSCLDYGESSESTDCDDDDASAYPGAPEVVGNEQDNDCDGGEVCFEDLDGDGYGTLATVVSTDSSCRDPVESRYSTDCDDDEPEVNPSVEEVCNDHVDNDCDGTEGPCDFWGEVSVAEADAKFVGEDVGGHAGMAVAIGDFDDDGQGEILVRAPWIDDWDHGTIYLVDGPFSGEKDLALADAKLRYDLEDRTIYRQIGVGDVNGDGLDDAMVNVHYWTRGPDYLDCGALFLAYGPFSGEMDLALADARFMECVDDKTASTGRASQLATGDANGDGKADIVVTDSGPDALFYGPVYGELTSSMADGRLVNDEDAGINSLSMGDVDGDGFDDVIAGAPGLGDDSSGAVYVVSGPASGDVYMSMAEAKLVGTDYGHLGELLISGDVNGDGYDEVIAWDSFYDVVHLFHGPLEGTHDTTESDAVLTIRTSTYKEGFALGDVDGDGAQDLLFGDYGADGRGLVHLAYGPFSGVVEIGETGARFRGERIDDGSAVVATGDIDDDGLDDVLIGASGEDSGGKDAGAAYLFFGSGL